MDRRIALLLVFLLLVLIAMAVPPPRLGASSPYPQPTGFAIITGERDWESQRATIRAAQATFVRIPMTEGFGNWPGMVDDVIADGVTHIALQTRDCQITYENVYRDLIDQAFQLKVHHNPQVQFYLEIGNEPDICGTGTEDYRTLGLSTLERIRPLVSYPNLQFILGLAIHPQYNRELLADGTVLANFDGVAYHIYAHQDIGDIPDTFAYWRDELSYLNTTLLLTEVGINGYLDPTLKAQRYRAFAVGNYGRADAIAFWTTDPLWSPQYHITPSMGSTLAGAECFNVTGQCMSGAFRDFWHRNGLDLGDTGVSYRESLMLWGYPLTGVFVMDGIQTQVFERMVFEYHPQNAEPYQILLRRLGAEWCETTCPR